MFLHSTACFSDVWVSSFDIFILDNDAAADYDDVQCI